MKGKAGTAEVGAAVAEVIRSRATKAPRAAPQVPA
jgi:hypothetical protein